MHIQNVHLKDKIIKFKNNGTFESDSIETEVFKISNGTNKFQISASPSLTEDQNLIFPEDNGELGDFLSTDGNGNLSWTTLSGGGGEGGLSNIVEDTTPQLGGDLDINGNKITSTSNGDIVIEPHGTGKVKFPTMSDFTGFPILLFTGSSGELTSSNSIKFNPTRDAIGVGITTGGSTTAGLYSSTQTTPQYKIHAIGDINDGATFCTETYADSTGASRFRFMKARGTPDSPAAINANDEIGRIEWLAYTGSSNGMEAKRSGYIIMTAEADAEISTDE